MLVLVGRGASGGECGPQLVFLLPNPIMQVGPVPVAIERFDFLSGGGEMGRLIREFDWSGHELGKPDEWPRSLKTAVSLILNSQHPMWIGWGPEMSFLYNDAYLHVLGLAKHPKSLGRPAAEVWAGTTVT